MNDAPEPYPSEAFLARYGDRLAAIGVWESDPEEAEIVWREPAALAGGGWIPFDLRFRADAADEAGSFYPDEAMFALWERYRPRHPERVARFQSEAGSLFAQDAPDDPIAPPRAVARASVVVRRGGEPDDVFHALEVLFTVPGDDEHPYYAEYDERTDRFTEFSCA